MVDQYREHEATHWGRRQTKMLSVKVRLEMWAAGAMLVVMMALIIAPRGF
jgi:hypothetical protein